MVSQKQFERVQSYIRKGIEEGAEVLVGGEGHPEGFEAGYFVKPTVFVNVKNDMSIAREEAPWGGFKYSGLGREYGQYGIKAFLEPKAILEA